MASVAIVRTRGGGGVNRGWIRNHVLIPLAVAMGVLFLSFALTAHWIMQSETKADVSAHIDCVRHGLNVDLDEDATAMEAVLGFLMRDKDLMAALDAKDRHAMLVLSEPTFTYLRDKLNITHLYFTGSDRVNILRVHQPDRYGDTINRFTTLEAERTGQRAHGVELGPLGTLTLRVVHPYYDGKRLVGFIELGHELGHLPSDIREGYEVETQILIYKKGLVRKDWESGMQMLGRPSHWDDYEDWILSSGTLGEVPKELLACAGEGCTGTKEGFKTATANGKSYLADCVPFHDAQGRTVGKLLVLADVTASYARARITVALAGLAGLVLGGFLAAFFLALSRVHRQLADSYRRLAEEGRAKEEAQRLHAEDSAKAHRDLQMVIDGIADPFMVIDKDYRIVQCNAVVRQAAGGIDPAALGMKCHRVSRHRDSPCDGTDDTCPLKVVFKTKQPVRLVHTHFGADGSERIIEIVASPVLNDAGEVMQVIESCRDITERRRAEEELRRVNQRLEELATTDDLTGLWNRRWFIGMLDREMQRRRRQGADLVLAMFDIDHLKTANDTYGHAFGDHVIVETARLLKAEARVTDVVARYAGDEFILLMPDTSEAEALKAVERVRQKLAERPISDGKNTIRITVSAGVAAAEGSAAIPTDLLIRLADNALYEAKRTGRNRTCISRPACPLPAADRLS